MADQRTRHRLPHLASAHLVSFLKRLSYEIRGRLGDPYDLGRPVIKFRVSKRLHLTQRCCERL